ncbi:MAG: hypothetical protein KC416_11600 [Myxococcales bacterium]|nr:hypothetical protein [Myxococcales bacterium]
MPDSARFCGTCGEVMGEPDVGQTVAVVRGAVDPKATVVGLPRSKTLESSVPPPPVETSSKGPPPTSPKAPRSRTMIGVPLSGPPGPAEPAAPAETAPEGSPTQGAPTQGSPTQGSSTQGAPSPAGALVSPKASAAGRTMVGIHGIHDLTADPLARERGMDAANGGQGSSEAFASDGGAVPGAQSLSPRPSFGDVVVDLPVRGFAWARAALGVGGVLFLVALGGLALWWWGDSHGPRVEVVQQGTTDALVFHLPSAPAGTRVRFHGREQDLYDGRATFPVGEADLRIGHNELEFMVLYADGRAEKVPVRLAIPFRFRVQVGGLGAPDPSVSVLAQALPGTRVFLDGELLTLVDGVGRRSFGVAPASPAGVFHHVVPYRVVDKDGAVQEGELVTHVSQTSLTIESPPDGWITEEPTAIVRGIVVPGTQVTINGNAVTPLEGRFEHPEPLPREGDLEIRIEAVREGRAPHRVVRHVTRVPDLARAAKAFKADPISYAELTADPAGLEGTRVRLEGRVYNVETLDDRTSIQMVLKECAAGETCPLWVTYPRETKAKDGSWVRVAGTAAGEQKYRAADGTVHSVPRVAAQFVEVLR